MDPLRAEGPARGRSLCSSIRFGPRDRHGGGPSVIALTLPAIGAGWGKGPVLQTTLLVGRRKGVAALHDQSANRSTAIGSSAAACPSRGRAVKALRPQLLHVGSRRA